MAGYIIALGMIVFSFSVFIFTSISKNRFDAIFYIGMIVGITVISGLVYFRRQIIEHYEEIRSRGMK